MPINLLPWREIVVERARKQFFILIAFTITFTLILCLIWHYHWDKQISHYQTTNQYLLKTLPDATSKQLGLRLQQIYTLLQIIRSAQCDQFQYFTTLAALQRSLDMNVAINKVSLAGKGFSFTVKSQSLTDTQRYISFLESQVFFKNIQLTSIDAQSQFSVSGEYDANYAH